MFPKLTPLPVPHVDKPVIQTSSVFSYTGVTRILIDAGDPLPDAPAVLNDKPDTSEWTLLSGLLPPLPFP